jgi:hypothetical protein
MREARRMSQKNVEWVIGRLVTDEALRHQFLADPRRTLQELAGSGVELTMCELRALLSMDPRLLARLADAIDPRLQKSDLREGAS